MKKVILCKPKSSWSRYLVLGLLCASPLTSAVVPKEYRHKLWLPSSQKQLMPNLWQAAQEVMGDEACTELVRGEYMDSKSKPDKPVFRILCRDENRKTYAVLVDGTSFERLHATGETRLQQKQRHLPQYSRRCLQELKSKTERMIKPRWPEGAVLSPTKIDNEAVEYEVDFSAETLTGRYLDYRGYCHFTSLNDLVVEVRPRPKD